MVSSGMARQPRTLLDIRVVYYFLVVARELNLHKAADALGISQPPLTRQIRQLEEDIGVPLFLRHSKGMTLTPAGKKLVSLAQPLLVMHDSVLASVGKKRHGKKHASGPNTALDGLGQFPKAMIQTGLDFFAALAKLANTPEFSPQSESSAPVRTDATVMHKADPSAFAPDVPHPPVSDSLTKKVEKIGVQSAPRPVVVGLALEFGSGVFTQMEAELFDLCGPNVQIRRMVSPRLAEAVQQGEMDVALVSVPLETHGLPFCPTRHSESFVAAVPDRWAVSLRKSVTLTDLRHYTVFWSAREANPAFYDYAKGVFAQVDFTPQEQKGHDTDALLARVGKGEGAALLPASFADTPRKGVVFLSLADAPLRLRLGVVARPGKETLMRQIAALEQSRPEMFHPVTPK